MSSGKSPTRPIVGEDIGNATDGGVPVGVHGQQPGTGLNEPMDGEALGARGSNGGDALEQQRMVRHEELGAPFNGLFNGGEGRIHGEHDLRDGSGWPSDNQSYLVPFLGKRFRPELLHCQEDLTERGGTWRPGCTVLRFFPGSRICNRGVHSFHALHSCASGGQVALAAIGLFEIVATGGICSVTLP
jgi:hypothetical protein